MLYVEMLADGTVPQDVRLTGRRPTILPEADGVEGDYARAELTTGTGWVAYAFAIADPLDEEGMPPGPRDPVYVEVIWVDDDGYDVKLHRDPLVAAASVCNGWGDMRYEVEYQTPGDAGPNLCAWGGYGDDWKDDPTAFVHLYERRLS